MADMIEFINRYRARAGIPPQASSSLVFEDRYEVDFHSIARDTVAMTSALLKVDASPDFARRLPIILQANLALSSRMHGTLSFDEAQNDIILFDTITFGGASETECFGVVDRFVNEVAALKSALDRHPEFGSQVTRPLDYSSWRP